MTSIIHLITLQFGAGVMALATAISHTRVPASLFRLLSAAALLALLVAQMSRPDRAVPTFNWLMSPGPPWTLVALAALYATLVWSGRTTAAGRMAWPMMIAAAFVLYLEARLLFVAPPGSGGWTVAAAPAAYMSAAGLLASAIVAMLLGHWYLVAPGLPIHHLRRITLVFGAAVVARLAVAAPGAAQLAGAELARVDLGDPTYWLGAQIPFLAIRFLVGIVLPAVLAIRIDRQVRIRDTQKATGLLYVAVIFVLFGELLASYLLVVTGVPV